MHDLLVKVLTTVRGMWRFRWWTLVTAWILFLSGSVVILMMPDVYKSSAKIFIDTQSVLKPLLKGLAVDTDMQNKVYMLTRVVSSRPNLEKVIRETDLDLQANTPRELENLIIGVQSRVKVSVLNQKKKNLYAITYSDKDPNIAYKVVQTLLDSLVEETLGSSRADTMTAQKFLKQQLDEYEKRLVEAEQKLAEFKKNNVGLMPSEGGSYYKRLQADIDLLQQKQFQLRQASNRRNELAKQLQGESQSIGTSEFDARIQERQVELNALLLRFTEEHPDVIAIQETIAQLEKRKQAAQGLPDDAAAQDGLGLNPVYQSIKIAMSEVDVEIATLKADIAEQQRRINELKGLVDTVPEVEAKLSRLTRDYSVNKMQYEELLQRYESAKLSQGADQSNDEIKFRIINPPIVPFNPSGPNRKLFLAALLLVSLGAGVGVAYLLNEVKSVYCSALDLSESTGLPVLGAVSIKWETDERKKVYADVTKLVVGFGGLFLVFVGMEVFQIVMA